MKINTNENKHENKLNKLKYENKHKNWSINILRGYI